MTNHASLNYFAARYGLRLVGVVIPGGSTTSEPSVEDVLNLIETVQKYDVPGDLHRVHRAGRPRAADRGRDRRADRPAYTRDRSRSRMARRRRISIICGFTAQTIHDALSEG